jgi:hypothetical protein
MPESAGAEQKVLVKSNPEREPRFVRPQAEVGWAVAGWLGLTLALAGLADLVLLWIPVQFGVPEWEFATVASTTSAMPLVTIGLAGLVGSAAFRGSRWLLWVVGVVLAVGAVALAVGMLLFLTNVPMAIRATADAARLGILKAIAKTAVLGLLFGSTYVAGAFWSLKLATGKTRGS